MSIMLISDSGSDLQTNEDITIVPLTIEMDEKKYLDGIDIKTDTFYDILPKVKSSVKTSQPSPTDFVSLFNKAKEENKDVLVLTMSSGLSGTNNSANLAKTIVNYDRIFIVDSIEATIGLRLLIDQAISMIKKGMKVEDIVSAIEELKHKIIVFVMVDTLEYLLKGGRISKSQAYFGELLSVKPIIRVRYGKLETVTKALGRTRAIKKFVDFLKNEEIDFTYEPYFLYTKNKENSDKLIEKLKEKYPMNEKNNFEMGPTIGAHIGPNAMGIAYVGFKKQICE